MNTFRAIVQFTPPNPARENSFLGSGLLGRCEVGLHRVCGDGCDLTHHLLLNVGFTTFMCRLFQTVLGVHGCLSLRNK